jgi:hypothetical protein
MRLLLDSTLVRCKTEGLTEDMINDLFDYAGSERFSEREKAALHYADLFKQGEHSIDKDEVYTDLAKHFSDEEIIELGLFCAEVDGVGKFVKSLNVLSWEEACELNPNLNERDALVEGLETVLWPQGVSEPARLVFIDETWTSTRRHRHHGTDCCFTKPPACESSSKRWARRCFIFPRIQPISTRSSRPSEN